MQTSRVTDLRVNLSTRTAPHGLTTRARFCQLMGMQGQNFDAAVNALKDFNLNTRACNRMSSSIRFMQQNQISLVLGKGTATRDEHPLVFSRTIANTLRASPSKHFFAYTDGSTTPNAQSPNSGCSVVLTDHEDKYVWSGGLVVRSDGNNFIPELAAASCDIKAIPNDKFLTL